MKRQESRVMDIMMQLYDQEEIMRMHVMGKCRDAAICAIVETYQDLGMTSIEAVNKIAEKFSLSKERAEEEVQEYWKE